MKLPRENGREEKSPRSIPMLNAVDKDKNREMTIVSAAQRLFCNFDRSHSSLVKVIKAKLEFVEKKNINLM